MLALPSPFFVLFICFKLLKEVWEPLPRPMFLPNSDAEPQNLDLRVFSQKLCWNSPASRCGHTYSTGMTTSQS